MEKQEEGTKAVTLVLSQGRGLSLPLLLPARPPSLCLPLFLCTHGLLFLLSSMWRQDRQDASHSAHIPAACLSCFSTLRSITHTQTRTHTLPRARTHTLWMQHHTLFVKCTRREWSQLPTAASVKCRNGVLSPAASSCHFSSCSSSFSSSSASLDPDLSTSALMNRTRTHTHVYPRFHMAQHDSGAFSLLMVRDPMQPMVS